MRYVRSINHVWQNSGRRNFILEFFYALPRNGDREFQKKRNMLGFYFNNISIVKKNYTPGSENQSLITLGLLLTKKNKYLLSIYTADLRA